MVIQHHSLNGHEFEETPQNSESQGNLFCFRTCNHIESDMTQQLNNTNENRGSSQSCGPGGSGERFRWKGRLPILWCRSLNPRQGAQDFECVTKHCFLKTKQNKTKLYSEGVRTLPEFVLQILLRDVEGIWIGLSLQNQVTSCWRVRHVVNILHQVENESRKSVPYGVYIPVYHIVSADHFSAVVGQARNAQWFVHFCQFLWVVR